MLPLRTLYQPVFFALVVAGCTLPARAATLFGDWNTLFGDWSTPTGSVVRIEPCNAAVCLKIVRLSPSAPETTDQHNPDTSLRRRPLCGLVIGTGFHRDGPNRVDAGSLYDPKSGHTYKGEITAQGSSLKLHGYIGIPLFGRTEIWHRAPAGVTCH
jgi:uncharacterized protein (DUF2147 family)